MVAVCGASRDSATFRVGSKAGSDTEASQNGSADDAAAWAAAMSPASVSRRNSRSAHDADASAWAAKERSFGHNTMAARRYQRSRVPPQFPM
jgi:hypothetical protein